MKKLALIGYFRRSIEIFLSLPHPALFQVRWYKNGAPLPEASRFRPSFEFGFVSLDILYAYPEDNGDYELVAENGKGEVTEFYSLYHPIDLIKNYKCNRKLCTQKAKKCDQTLTFYFLCNR